MKPSPAAMRLTQADRRSGLRCGIGNLEELLAPVFALEQAGERRRRDRKLPLDVDAVLEFALRDPGGELRSRLLRAVQVVEDEEALHPAAPDHEVQVLLPRPGVPAVAVAPAPPP